MFTHLGKGKLRIHLGLVILLVHLSDLFALIAGGAAVVGMTDLAVTGTCGRMSAFSLIACGLFGAAATLFAGMRGPR